MLSRDSEFESSKFPLYLCPTYLGFAEKVHKTNLGGRELMESGIYHLSPAFCLGFSAQVQGF
ncbi:hypothetical protein KR51_00032750 [Rubidibacter lacunae KORDI 51-2]|uniref:Uncharacterized protein n=1 Tax=Rubidibacter lacunae KORDI 51-2 TaxID=582515 RepID=U5DFE8_9CHRO|nr:hypothetical protein KR51_00032750 [Rubidibacter lacunae KORDI 51-2]